jgi:hypothetical protein
VSTPRVKTSGVEVGEYGHKTWGVWHRIRTGHWRIPVVFDHRRYHCAICSGDAMWDGFRVDSAERTDRERAAYEFGYGDGVVGEYEPERGFGQTGATSE